MPIATPVPDVGAPVDSISNADDGWFPGRKFISSKT